MTEVLGTALPEGWTASRLKRVTSLLNRGSAPDYVDDGPVRAISQAANQPGGLDWERTRFHDAIGDPLRLKGYLLPDDILINSTGTGTLGRIGFFQGGPDEIPCMADTHVTVARAIPSDVDPRFLYYWLSSIPFQEYIYAALVVGATNQIELNRDRLGDASVPLPPAEEQRRISRFLDVEVSRIDRMKGNLEALLKLLFERAAAVLDLAIDANISRFGTAPLRRFVAGVNQGSSPQCDSVPAAEGEWGVLKVSCLRPGEFYPGENKRLPTELEFDPRDEVRQGDLLVTRANTPALVGSTAVVPAVRKGLLLSDKIFRVRLDARLDPHYVSAIASGSRVRGLCAAVANGASQSMANLRFEEIKEWPVPLANGEAQKALVSQVAESRAHTATLRRSIECQLKLLSERRRALITAAVTGQIDVTTARGVRVP
ncbi:restriction endonuclease subunit S [Streptomyces sp. NPDC059517]|uniref:restriction endonuclease subunit S n=1 Tax=Streptomyces sp. NPDC059517 TaxID=3346855 RepID=UPI0036AA698D